MELTKPQTYQILFNQNKLDALQHKYKYTTKYEWWCLSCMTPIFISYKQYGRNAIFCDKCYPLFAKKETIVQYQYIRVLKERQIKLIETQVNFTDLN